MRLRRLLACTVLAHPWLALILALILTLASVQVAVRRLSFTSTRDALTSPSERLTQLQRQYRQAFADPDRALIVIQSDDRDHAKQFASALANRLRNRVQGVEEVIDRFDLTSLDDHFLLYLSSTELMDLRRRLQQHRSLLQELSAKPGLNGLFRLIEREISTALVGHLFTGFLEEEGGEDTGQNDLAPLIALLEQLDAWTEGPRAYVSPWDRFFVATDPHDERDGYVWSDDKRFLFVLVNVKGDPQSFNQFQRPIEGIREEIRTLQMQYPHLQVGVTGDPALEYDEVKAAMWDTSVATLIALIGVTLLVVVIFRGVSRPMMGTVALIMGVCWAFGFAAITVGHLNMLSMVLGPMLIGIGMDYGIHLLARYEEERSRGHCIREALERTFEGAGPGIVHAAVTTVVALFTLMLTSTGALWELGFITGSGLLLTLVSTFVVLPPLLLLRDRGESAMAYAHPSLSLRPPAFLEAWYRRSRVVLGLSGLATVTALLAMGHLRFDGNVLHLQAEGTESVDWELKIIQHAERSTSYGVMLAKTLEEVTAKTRALEALPSIRKVESIATMIPEEQEGKFPLLRNLGSLLGGVDPPVVFLTPVDLNGLLESLRRIKAKMLTPEQVEKWDGNNMPSSEAMGRVSSLIESVEGRLTTGDPTEIRRRLSAYQVELFRDLRTKLAQLFKATDSGPVGLDDLPQDLKREFVGRDGSYLLRVFPRHDPWELSSQTEFIADMRGVDPDAIGDLVESNEVITAIKRGYQQVGIYALIGVATLFLLNFRDVRYVVLAAIPLLVGAVWTAGLMQLFRLSFNLANLVIVPLIVAPGVENGVLILYRYREEAESAVLPKSVAKGVTLSCLTTMAGFGSLMIAHHRGAFSIGLLVTLGVGSVLAVSLTLLPAVLTLSAKRPVSIDGRRQSSASGRAWRSDTLK